MTEKTSFSDLIGKISVRVEKSDDFTQDFIRELVGIIETGLRSSGSVSISGFGKFELRWMDERNGTHPQTGDDITIPAQNKVEFKPYKSLREYVNRPYARMKPQILEDTPEGETEPGTKPAAIPPLPVYEGEEPDDEERDDPVEDDPGDDPFQLEDPVYTDEAEIPGKKEKDEAKDTPPFPFFIEEQDEEDEAETLEDLLIERPSPVKSDVDELVLDFDESRLAEQVQKEGSYKWSYIAAAIVGLLIVLAVYYFLSDQRDSEIILPEVPEREMEPERLIEENDLNGIEETELIAIIIEDGQNLWNLALNYFGDPYLWPWIYYLNSDKVENPNLVYTGTDLTIPIPSDVENLLEFELEQIAFGYVSVYQWYREHNHEEARYYLWAAGIYNSSVFYRVEDRVDPEDLRFARNR